MCTLRNFVKEELLKQKVLLFRTISEGDNYKYLDEVFEAPSAGKFVVLPRVVHGQQRKVITLGLTQNVNFISVPKEMRKEVSSNIFSLLFRV